MKLLIAALATETNSFSPIPTGRMAFEEAFVGKNATQNAANLFTAPLHIWRSEAEALGWEVVESLSAIAQPAGPTVRAVYEGYRDDILHDIRATMPDILLLSLHGAMMAEGYDDCEGDLLVRAREILGPKAIIGVEIDPHSHLTEAMLDTATLIIAYKEYPHTDSAARATEVFALAAEAAKGRISPVMRDYDCKMMAMFNTPDSPMREFVGEMQSLEGHAGVLSISLIHGFPWGDHPRAGARMLAITNADTQSAEDIAAAFGRMLWESRHDLPTQWPDMDAALKEVATATAFPLVLADFADNAGGGAPSDSTYFLNVVLHHGLKDIALGLFWDPAVVRICQEVGVGATLDVRLGGKVGKMSGDPVDLRVKVRAIKADMAQVMGESAMKMGTGVWLETGGVHIVVCTLRTQCFHPSAFTDLGIPLDEMKAIIVKSSQHFYAGFAPMAAKIIQVATPGTLAPDLTQIPYVNRNRPYWPKSETPFDD